MMVILRGNFNNTFIKKQASSIYIMDTCIIAFILDIF